MSRRLPPQTAPNIGDRLSGAGVDWAWYSGGWSNADGDIGEPGWTNGTGPACSDPNTLGNAAFPNCPDKLFQFHHQPFNYYASLAPGTAARTAHLRDEQEFLRLRPGPRQGLQAQAGELHQAGRGRERASRLRERDRGSSHLVELLPAVQHSRCAKDTMVIVTYDEFGGQWDHVPPPGQGGSGARTTSSGPGTRIPALVVAPHLRDDFVVDHTQYDTTSILATIERRFGLAPLSSRDAAVHDLSRVFHAK